MKTNIINIGNSQGVIRQGWTKDAQKMHAAGDDELLLGDSSNEFDKEEWTW